MGVNNNNNNNGFIFQAISYYKNRTRVTIIRLKGIQLTVVLTGVAIMGIKDSGEVSYWTSF